MIIPQPGCRRQRAQNLWMVAIAAVLILAPSRAPALQPVDIGQLEEEAIQASVDHVAESVVRIETLGGLERVEGVTLGFGPTTGLVVSEDGFIVSSAFGFVHQPTSILVTRANGERAAARVVARDESRMLVLLKADFGSPLPVPEAVPREQMRVGQWTIAVGRTFSVEQPNVSVGVLSATNRIWGKAIQTDAKISPSNYGGPLIDIEGRVLGVLVPLSPQGETEMAGAEWYDSGIGFAVPLVDIQARLDTWKQGQDLKPGLLGISPKGQNELLDEAVIGVVRFKSPAELAGLKVDDKIVSANGEPIRRIAQLKHVLGRLYAGDTLTLEVLRNGEKITASATLVGELIPYTHPFLGILPLRGPDEQPGIPIRFVYPASPAAEAGMVAGDRLLAWNGEAVEDTEAAQQLAGQQTAGDTIRVRWRHGEEELEKEITLAALPSEVPDSLPEARGELPEFAGERPEVGRVDVKLPEEPNLCVAWVPESYDPRAKYGLLVVLHPSGQYDAQQIIDAWKDACEQHDLILLAPQATDQLWRPTELALVRKTIEQLRGRYQIDAQRIVVHGTEAGGAMAYLAALTERDLIRGVAPVGIALPPRVQVPENDPLQRLAIFTAKINAPRVGEAIERGIERLRELKYPVTVIELTSPGGLSDEQRRQLARWTDTLDRL